jgi:hypothetical protein
VFFGNLNRSLFITFNLKNLKPKMKMIEINTHSAHKIPGSSLLGKRMRVELKVSEEYSGCDDLTVLHSIITPTNEQYAGSRRHQLPSPPPFFQQHSLDSRNSILSSTSSEINDPFKNIRILSTNHTSPGLQSSPVSLIDYPSPSMTSNTCCSGSSLAPAVLPYSTSIAPKDSWGWFIDDDAGGDGCGDNSPFNNSRN